MAEPTLTTTEPIITLPIRTQPLQPDGGPKPKLIPAGSPATMYTLSGQQHVFFRGADNGIYHVFYDPATNGLRGPEQWDVDQPGNFQLGNPATLFTPGANQSAGFPIVEAQHVFHVNSDHGLLHIWYDGGRHVELWANNAQGTPAPLYSPGTWERHVFYRGTDDSLYHVYWDSVPRPDGSVSDPELCARGAAGDPATMYSPGQLHVFYRDGNGYIWHVLYEDGNQTPQSPEQWVGPQVLVTETLAASDPVTLFTPDTNQQHIFFRGTDSNLYHVFWDPGSQSLHGPEKWIVGVGSDPATMYTPNGQQHVFVRGGGDNIDKISHIFYDPSIKGLRDDGFWASNSVSAASDLAALYTPNGQQHVFYRGTDNGIYQVFYDPSSNSVHGPEQWA